MVRLCDVCEETELIGGRMFKTQKQKILEQYLGISDDIPEEFEGYQIAVSDLTIEELSNGKGGDEDDYFEAEPGHDPEP